MDWDLAIARNREALQGIVAGLIAMAGIAMGAPAATLPRSLRNAILRLLRPAESAARRLIVIAARGMKVAAPVETTPLWPAGHLPRKGGDRLSATSRQSVGEREWAGRRPRSISPLAGEMAGRPEGGQLPRAPAFTLSDPRKRFAWLKPKTVPGLGPRISFPGCVDPVFAPVIVNGPDDPIPATRLLRRLAALQAALADIPRQARRLAQRQASMAGPRPSRLAALAPQDEGGAPPRSAPLRPHPEPPRCVRPRPHPEVSRSASPDPHPEVRAQRTSKGEGSRFPLRPGAPPGRRRRGTHEVDALLAECHTLALEACDTS